MTVCLEAPGSTQPEAILVCNEEFASPDRSIQSGTSAVPRYSEIRSFQTVLGGTRCDVGFMMLNLYKGNSDEL